MHYAAMAGDVPTIDLLASRGLSADDLAIVDNAVTPLQVALQYKRLPAARRLQQLRDAMQALVHERDRALEAAEAEEQEVNGRKQEERSGTAENYTASTLTAGNDGSLLVSSH